MVSYFKKDISFSKKWIVIVLLYCLIVGFVFVKDGGESFYFVEFLFPFFAVYFPLSKILSMEDSRDTRDFLRRMPQRAYGRIIARILYIIVLLTLSFAVKIFYKQLLIENYTILLGINIEKEVAFFCGFLAYFLIELIVFYKTSYHMAQNSGLFAFAIAIVIGLILKYTNININLLANISAMRIILIGLGVNLALIYGVIVAEKSS